MSRYIARDSAANKADIDQTAPSRDLADLDLHYLPKFYEHVLSY